MIVSIVIITYSSGGVIFSRFYGDNFRTEAMQAEWLKKLRDTTAPDWPLLKEDHDEQVASISEVQIMYKLLGDVVLMLAGTDEHDALLMTQLSRCMAAAIRTTCRIADGAQADVRVSTEKKILQRYADLCLVVDEMVDDGDIDHLDPKIVAKLIQLRPSS